MKCQKCTVGVYSEFYSQNLGLRYYECLCCGHQVVKPLKSKGNVVKFNNSSEVTNHDQSVNSDILLEEMAMLSWEFEKNRDSKGYYKINWEELKL